MLKIKSLPNLISESKIVRTLVEFTLIKNGDIYHVKAKSEFEESTANLGKDQFKSTRKINAELFINDSRRLIMNEDEYSLVYPKYLGFYVNQANYFIKLLKHGIPDKQGIVELPINFSVYSDNIILDLKENTFFLKSLLIKLEHEFGRNKVLSEVAVRNKIDGLTHYFFREINEGLKAYTDIGGVTISPNFNLYPSNGKDPQKVDVYNFFLEFFINENWLPYNALSDGSKRLFYIFSEILCHNKFEIIIPPELSAEYGDLKSPTNIILLEEPELGIHPHQLHLLMQFIKEQSRYKQIIISTHSSQVLDTIGSGELDRIIICEYDGKKGTQLRHLSEKETSKAKNYMEDAFLSDYRRFSDLEPVS